MNEETTSLPDPAAPSDPQPVPPPRRLWLKALVLLYAASMLAAALVVWRSDDRRPAAAEGKRPLDVARSLIPSSAGDSVGVIHLSGVITTPDDGPSFGSGPKNWSRKIEKLAEKKEVKAIVLEINSPGGSVGAVQEIHGTILRMRKKYKKPFIAHFGDVAASGGYYVAAACDKIVSHPGSLLGSIGVIFSHSNIEGLLGKIGVRSESIKSGKMKDIGSMTRPMTAEERQLLQSLIDNAYGQFLGAVSEGRRMPKEKLRALADGRIFTGEQGLQAGLVDELGGLWDAVQLAGKLANIKGEPKVYRENESFANIMELLNSEISDALSPQAGLLRELRSCNRAGLEYRWSY
ncbi:MAG: hypothetical protein A2X36_05940 [Elusimicrobia bacterium GWA2_69_24]|nr:MAG: hypothetical protein A2X36_05940 [Elusimicrobia bacterium GWA2_69_24]HBL17299.1 signal peptide peptidase SppA [Elusimicrobiota bacterium]